MSMFWVAIPFDPGQVSTWLRRGLSMRLEVAIPFDPGQVSTSIIERGFGFASEKSQSLLIQGRFQH